MLSNKSSLVTTSESPNVFMASSLLDKLGILTSGGCIIHCIVIPLLLLITPGVVSEALENEKIHILLACTALFFITIAVARGYQRHQSFIPLLFGSMGLTLIWGSLLIEDPHWLESLVTSLGAVSTATAHILNHRFTQEKKTIEHTTAR